MGGFEHSNEKVIVLLLLCTKIIFYFKTQMSRVARVHVRVSAPLRNNGEA